MKRFNFVKLLVVTLVVVITSTIATFAGTGVIQFSDPTVTRDKSFNIACKVNQLM